MKDINSIKKKEGIFYVRKKLFEKSNAKLYVCIVDMIDIDRQLIRSFWI